MIYQLAIVAALAACSATAFRGDLDFMTTADMERYFSVSTAAEVPEYDIVSPTAYSAGGKHRRSIEFEETHKEIKFAAFGENFHVSLEENTELLPSSLEVDRHNADGSIDQLPLKSRHCFHHGNLLSHDISKVAVSTCNGMSGMISIDKYDMFIQPLTEDHADRYKRRARRAVENPHVIYRKSTDQPSENKDEHFCGMDPDEFPHVSAMLHENMDEMDTMHASFSSGAVEVQADFNYDNGNTDETPTTDGDYHNLDTTTDYPWLESTTGYFDDVGVETADDELPGDGNPGGNPGGSGDNPGHSGDNPGHGGDNPGHSGDNPGHSGDNPGHGGDNPGHSGDKPGSGDGGSSRRKRQTKPTKYLEVRVMADVDMTNYHNEANVVEYALTLLNIVAARYKEKSLERVIVIHVVKLGYLKSDTVRERTPNGAQVEFVVQKDGPSTLTDWSYFQYRTNSPYDQDSQHWDNAIFMSRKNLEVNGRNSLLGIAWGNATCYGPRQASVNQDQGLSSGIVIAHEIGHTLGMNHDSDNGCVNGINVMSSHRPNGPGSFQWSRCSVVDLERFLSDRYKTCLNDRPTGTSQWPLDASQRPGATISANQQCVLHSTDVWKYTGACPSQNPANICANLVCRNIYGSCSSSVAAAEGTPCGSRNVHMICVSGQCVVDNTPPPTATYAWRAGIFGSCSVTCGTGVQTRSVTCYSSTNSPVTDNFCSTQQRPTITQTCTLQICTVPTTYAWRTGTFGSCSATCGTGEQTRSVTCYSSTTNSAVNDNLCSGTKPPDTKSCDQGECLKAFWVPSQWDTCNDATCQQTRRVLCVVVNGVNYNRVDDSQCDKDKPSTTQNCLNNNNCNASVWVASDYSQCSASCGGGTRSRTVTCRPSTSSLESLSDSQCAQSETKPNTIESCNTQTCRKPVWVASDFSQCSASCGGGTMTRTVTCRPSTSSSESLSDSQCAQSGAKPSTREACNTQSCRSVYSWLVSNNYGACSVTCGTGTQSTIVLCFDARSREVADTFCSQPKPQGSTRQCNTGACGQWSTRPFAECSVTCGQGTQQLQVFCRSGTSTQLADSECDPKTKPSTQQDCNLGICPSNPPPNPPAGSNTPDQGVPCSGVWKRPVDNLKIFGNGQRNCKEVIVAQSGQKIQLTFSECNVRCNQGDYRGNIRDATEDDVPFCCTGPIDGTTGTNFVWTSETHVLQLEINDITPDQGFAVKVEFVGAPQSGCNTVITAPSGTVLSPNYPNSYARNQLCQTVIVAPPNKKVQLTYNEINFPSGWPYTCNESQDNVAVYDIDYLDGGLRYCGRHTSPNNLQKPSLDNKVLVQFSSNTDRYGGRGFSFSYVMV